jgi:serine protease inhibitor
MSRTGQYQRQLRELDDWIPFLRLELAYAVAEEATKKQFEQLLFFQAEEKWLSSDDRDICWIMKENLKKNRLVKMDANWVK